MAYADPGAAWQPRMRSGHIPMAVDAAAVRDTAVIPAVIDGGGYGPGAGRCSKQEQGNE